MISIIRFEPFSELSLIELCQKYSITMSSNHCYQKPFQFFTVGLSPPRASNHTSSVASKSSRSTDFGSFLWASTKSGFTSISKRRPFRSNRARTASSRLTIIGLKTEKEDGYDGHSSGLSLPICFFVSSEVNLVYPSQ